MKVDLSISSSVLELPLHINNFTGLILVITERGKCSGLDVWILDLGRSEVAGSISPRFNFEIQMINYSIC